MLKRTVRLTVQLPGAISSGSGVVVETERDGFYVVTAPHVIDGGTEIKVETFTQGGPRATQVFKNVRPLVADQTSEFALLYVKGRFPLSPIPLCPESKFPQDGAKVLSIGCDGGDPPSCHVNLLIGHNQVHWATSERAAKGRSGGPLITQDGYVIGACCCTSAQMTFYSYSGRTNRLLAKTGYGNLLGTKRGVGAPAIAKVGSPAQQLPNCPRCQNPNTPFALPGMGQQLAIPGFDPQDFFDDFFAKDFPFGKVTGGKAPAQLMVDCPERRNCCSAPKVRTSLKNKHASRALPRGRSTTIIITNDGLFIIEE